MCSLCSMFYLFSGLCGVCGAWMLHDDNIDRHGIGVALTTTQQHNTDSVRDTRVVCALQVCWKTVNLDRITNRVYVFLLLYTVRTIFCSNILWTAALTQQQSDTKQHSRSQYFRLVCPAQGRATEMEIETKLCYGRTVILVTFLLKHHPYIVSLLLWSTSVSLLPNNTRIWLWIICVRVLRSLFWGYTWKCSTYCVLYI